ncbi:MAG: ATP-binding cassette domain-containing protein [Thiotrichales bacterium]|nr:ATP-binding cassette domain-containing protein [Thiotrichales bacterium]
MSHSSITFKNLGFKIEQACLLDDLTGQFAAGQIHAIIGQNGAGKSTLLRCLTKEWQATAGEILFNQQKLNALSFAELALQRAVLSQQQEVAFAFSVEQLVNLGFEAQQTTWPKEIKHRLLNAVLEATDIPHLRHRDVLTLSGGEQKRAQLARVLAQIWPVEFEAEDAFAGKWLFLDEWSEALDLKHQVHIGCLFRQLADKGLGVVMVSHDLNQVMQLADTCTLLKAGKLVKQGAIQTVMTAQNLTEVLDIAVQVVFQPEVNQSVVLLKPLPSIKSE